MKARLRVKLREATALAILDAAEEVAASHGNAGANLQAIAERAGIAVGTIYNYFDDKRELFQALFDRRKDDLFEAIDSAAKKHAKASFSAQLEAFVRTVFEHFDQRRAFLRMSLEREPQAQLKKPKSARHPALQQLQLRAERVMRLGQRENKLRSDDTADLLAIVLVAMVRAVLVARADDSRALADETPRVISLFIDGAGT
jgi:AcrR family transcriptional regulator